MKAKEVERVLLEEGYACKLVGNSQVEVNGFSDPSDYRLGTIIWLGDIKYLTLKEEQDFSDIALLLCENGFKEKDKFKNVLICDDPRNAFLRLMELSQNDVPLVGVDKSAVIEQGTVFGKNVYVGPNCVIGKDVVIGNDCKIMAGSFIEHTTLGSNCSVYPNCVIGTAAFGFRKQESLVMEPHLGRVVLGNDVEVLSSSVIERGSTKDTVIGEGSKIACLTNIGHNVTVGRNCQIIGCMINGFASVGDESELIHCVVANRIKIGKNVKVGLNSTVVRDIPDNSVAFGSPARVRGDH